MKFPLSSKKYFSLGVFIFLFSVVGKISPAAELPPKTQSTILKKAQELLKQQPLAFRKNEGQWPENIFYQSNSNGANVYFLKNGLSFGFQRKISSVNQDQFASASPGKTEKEYFYLQSEFYQY